jgi:hypothetical protein
VLPTEQNQLSFAEWSLLVSGLMDDTPIGRLVALRRESDPKVLKVLSPEQKRMRADWASFCAGKRRSTPGSVASAAKEVEAMIKSLFS